MFVQLSIIATLAAYASAALTLNTPTDVSSGKNVTISWTGAEARPFTLYLHHTRFNSDFAVLNNVDPSKNSVTFVIPSVPSSGGYTFRAVNVGDLNEEYAKTGEFAIQGDAPADGVSNSAASASSGTGAGVTTTGVSSAKGTVTPATTPSGSAVTFPSGTVTGTGTIITASSAKPTASQASSSNKPNGASTLRVAAGAVVLGAGVVLAGLM